ncbi:hypothetical protein [Microlunatus parietis]|uniref:Uncharacterized protein n=1 Tax=Microlunatus parietis TaxID=682979 RepID=A0A7Y9I1U8_9ACTN|nr:hypothetical protein [Microlunatus parietis]NYE68681.1 hypothetical protein [Microlunatus parietis]
MDSVFLPADVDDWSLLDHCGVRNALERDGWRFVAAGDWAVVLGDPTGRYAARISPFERAYQYFVELCRRHPGNRWLPTIHAATNLAGGGHLTVMELLTPRHIPDDDHPDPVWSSDDSDLATVRADVERTYADCKANVQWWGSLDVKPAHFLLDSEGQLKLVDPFGLAGAELYGMAESDYPSFCKLVPTDERRYMLQIPHFSQSYAAPLLRTLRAVISAHDAC